MVLSDKRTALVLFFFTCLGPKLCTVVFILTSNSYVGFAIILPGDKIIFKKGSSSASFLNFQSHIQTQQLIYVNQQLDEVLLAISEV